jgi:hypothetical protein
MHSICAMALCLPQNMLFEKWIRICHGRWRSGEKKVQKSIPVEYQYHADIINTAIVSTLIAISFLVTSMAWLRLPRGHCITIQEEREMSKEFMKVVQTQFPLDQGPHYRRLRQPCWEADPEMPSPNPFDYQFYILHEDVYNAFATPAGHIFFNSGLFARSDSEEDWPASSDTKSPMSRAGTFPNVSKAPKKSMWPQWRDGRRGTAGGRWCRRAASAITMGSVAAGQSHVLAYSRENETQADQTRVGVPDQRWLQR